MIVSIHRRPDRRQLQFLAGRCKCYIVIPGYEVLLWVGSLGGGLHATESNRAPTEIVYVDAFASTHTHARLFT